VSDWSELRSGAMPEDWHEQNQTGYVPGGADKMAERVLTQTSAHERRAARAGRKETA
jgi:hypothetical protein